MLVSPEEYKKYALSNQVCPRFARGVSQVLSDLATWNESLVVISILPNAVRVATKQTFSEAHLVGRFANTGVRSETRDTAGAPRFLEQLAFTGTAKRPQAAFEYHLIGDRAERKSHRAPGEFGTLKIKSLRTGTDITCNA